MFRNVNGDGRLSARTGGSPSSSSPAAGPGVASAGVGAQESSWIGLVSRPALALLQKLVPGRLRGSPLSDAGAGWFSGEFRSSLIPEESDILRQLDDWMPPHLGYLPCERAEAAGALPRPRERARHLGGWFPTESLLLNNQALVLSSSQRGLLSKLSCPEGGQIYPETTAVFVHGGWKLGENSGGPPSLHKQIPKGGPTVVHGDTEVSTDPQKADSLEEKPPQRTGDHHLETPPRRGEESPPRPDADTPETEASGASGEVEEAAAPSCQNKAIAFIMGCPCSDDSQSECSDDDGGDGDDGFDSDGSSNLTLSSDEDEEEESDSEDEGEEEADGDSERLWSSLCRSVDPYNPQNFTASQHTGGGGGVLASTPPSSAQSSPATSPPCSSQDSWDDSSSSSEVDEESVRLWSTFSCSSDPYSPFNFTAPLRTQRPCRTGLKPPQVPTFLAVSPPDYRRDEAEERLDSGFSELPSCSSPPTTKQTCERNKKVRFCDQVEEFFASCGEEEEDRRGPWEELARDRFRFLRRCQDVEQSIAYCLQPQHRHRVFQRLTILHIHNT
ncbi:protein phosphatase 1 regulatory subunit 15B-like [Cololabis saira]|uniref:protein phosphatase 1 regulatory subunit 15B-like n=1 Tax=Cololabis saira TaxID=129043 RepID=UPI002AD2C12D|nr:protein phosphatase 1 regulatory subunit 15B-like [Cololabis saira]